MADAFLDAAPRMVDFLEDQQRSPLPRLRPPPGLFARRRRLDHVGPRARAGAVRCARAGTRLRQARCAAARVHGVRRHDGGPHGHRPSARRHALARFLQPRRTHACCATVLIVCGTPRHPAGHGQCAGGTSVLLAPAAQRASADGDAGGRADRGRRTDHGRQAAVGRRHAIVRCRRGVVLATGGLSRNPELRQRSAAWASAPIRPSPRARPATASRSAAGRRAPRRQPRQHRLLDAGLGARPARRQHGRVPASRAGSGQARR